ncbi:S4 domain-containing protein YaaA [Sporolactobacillus spathodeae]|uniref:S4 domain protein YaaA n=1 Tax=Sporolactobacillus spathodeae TaxID=1465502 RepID=A0ABS2Q4T6_9BACL|nr:S4 domain-containing protein YaaA [Sporolactobacillus spathodeae]MBM7656781.1 S4 domain protein YaaA [Sporolactobacillus spathodeae]
MEKKIRLNQGETYITLGQFLKFAGLIQTGGEAKHFLNEATIFVNGELESRRGRKLHVGDKILINDQDSFSIIGS